MYQPKSQQEMAYSLRRSGTCRESGLFFIRPLAAPNKSQHGSTTHDEPRPRRENCNKRRKQQRPHHRLEIGAFDEVGCHHDCCSQSHCDDIRPARAPSTPRRQCAQRRPGEDAHERQSDE